MFRFSVWVHRPTPGMHLQVCVCVRARARASASAARRGCNHAGFLPCSPFSLSPFFSLPLSLSYMCVSLAGVVGARSYMLCGGMPIVAHGFVVSQRCLRLRLRLRVDRTPCAVGL